MSPELPAGDFSPPPGPGLCIHIRHCFMFTTCPDSLDQIGSTYNMSYFGLREETNHGGCKLGNPRGKKGPFLGKFLEGETTFPRYTPTFKNSQQVFRSREVFKKISLGSPK